MITRKISADLAAILAVAGFAGCSQNADSSSAAVTTAAGTTTAEAAVAEKTVLKYGKAAGPYTVLFEEAVKPILEEQGYTLEVVEFSDLVQNDTALNEGEIDFNVEQHTAYAENFNASQNGDLTPITPIPTVPAGLFSAKYSSVDEIFDGAVVAVPNDASNTARAYALLQKAGWIKLDESKELATASQSDIVENPYNIQFVEMDSLNIPPTLDDFAFAVITGSIVYNAGIDPSTAILQEDILEHLILQLVVKAENKDTKWAQDIVSAYKSDEFKAYLAENNNGLWYVPEELQ